MNPLLKIVPPAWFFFFLFLGIAAHHLVPASRVFDVSQPILGTILLVLGLALPMYASSLFAKEKTEILPTSPTNTRLLTYGPFKYSRNPMYLGLVIAILGVAIAVGSLPVFLSAAAYFAVLNFVFIPFEEAKLARIFGAEFDAYRSRVRRWF